MRFSLYCQSNVRRLLPASDYFRVIEHSWDNETVLGSSRKLGGAAEHLIDGGEKRICRSTFTRRGDTVENIHEIISDPRLRQL